MPAMPNSKFGTIAGATATDPKFTRVVELFSKLQKRGGLGMRVQKSAKDEKGALLLVMGRPGEEPAPELKEIAELLGLDPNLDSYEVE